MKSLFNKVVFGLMVLTIAALASVSIMAQDEEKTAAYTKFTGCYKATDKTGITDCIAVGKDYMSKWGTPADQYNDFVGKQVVNLEKKLAALPLIEAYKEYNEGFKTKNPKMIFSGGKKVIALESKDSVKLDRTLVLVSTGYDAAFAATPDTSLIPETISLAKGAIRMIESGVTTEPIKCSDAANAAVESTWGGCGGYAYTTKDNALGWMNFIIARLTVDTNKDAARNAALLKEAAPYLYKALQYKPVLPTGPTYKGVPEISKDGSYASIGRYYLGEYNAAVDQWDRTCKAAADDTTATETDECKRIIGMQKAYAERAADAFIRAYNAIPVSTDAKVKAYRDKFMEQATALYKVRNKGKADGLNEFVSGVATKPLADPAGPVNPIIEETPAATGAATTPPATNGTKPVTAPATTPAKPATTPATTTKPASTPAKPAGSGKGTVAKGAAKKKVTR